MRPFSRGKTVKAIKACVISLGSTSSKWTIAEMKKYFEEVEGFSLYDMGIKVDGRAIEVLHKGKPMKQYDCVYVKGSFRFALLARAITAKIMNESYSPYSPTSYTLAHDKMLTHIQLEQFNIPMPQTYLTPSIESARALLKEITYPIVIKFPQGTGGKGVLFADSYASASSMLDALEILNQPFIIQQYLDVDGKDTRCIVVGDKVVAAYQRVAAPREERANIHAGGVGAPHTPNPVTKRIAVKTAKAIGAEIVGVDILETSRGPYVIEVNISPGLQGVTKTTKVNVAECIAQHLFKRTKEFCEQRKKKQSQQIIQGMGIGSGHEGFQDLITTVDVRGDRILLPDIVSKVSKLSQEETVVIKVKEGAVHIERFVVEEKKK